MKPTRKGIDLTLVGLIVLDVVLTIWAFFFPRDWFFVFHGVLAIDPEGLLRRCGATWAAFTLFQTIALFRWRREPHWLAVVAGLRLSEIFTDWTYLAFAGDVTIFARITLFITSPANLFLGLYFLKSYKQQRKPC
jgi:hypothetical protein